MCEDYPCCGHEPGYCGYTETQAQRDARFYDEVERRAQFEDEYGYEPDWD